MHRSHDLS